jgi:hypothetical protein
MKIRLSTLGLALLLVALLASPAMAAESRPALFGSYWSSFVEYWESAALRQNGIVMLVLGVGVIALFIITRGKWRK